MLRVAIVGTGSISAAHLKGYQSLAEDCEIVGLCDIRPEKALVKREEYSLEDIPVFEDHKELLDTLKPDLVSVCTPPFEHASITIDALEGGAHVLCEKPMASSLEECDAMIKAQEKSGRLLSVVSQNRFLPQYWRLKKLIESGRLGRVNHFQVDSHWWRGANYYDLWWRGTWEKEGGGCTLNHAVHHIDIALWIAGLPQRVLAVMANTSHHNSETEDISMALLRYKNGTQGLITSSLIHHGEEQSIRFQCENAAVAAPWEVRAMETLDNGFPRQNEALESELKALWESIPVQDLPPHSLQIKNVLDAVSDRDRLLIDGFQGRMALELISAIYASAIEDRPMVLPISGESPYYRRGGLMDLAPRFNKKQITVDELGTDPIRVSGDEISPAGKRKEE